MASLECEAGYNIAASPTILRHGEETFHRRSGCHGSFVTSSRGSTVSPYVAHIFSAERRMEPTAREGFEQETIQLDAAAQDGRTTAEDSSTAERQPVQGFKGAVDSSFVSREEATFFNGATVSVLSNVQPSTNSLAPVGRFALVLPAGSFLRRIPRW
jgi:hypothetical protein